MVSGCTVWDYRRKNAHLKLEGIKNIHKWLQLKIIGFLHMDLERQAVTEVNKADLIELFSVSYFLNLNLVVFE